MPGPWRACSRGISRGEEEPAPRGPPTGIKKAQDPSPGGRALSPGAAEAPPSQPGHRLPQPGPVPPPGDGTGNRLRGLQPLRWGYLAPQPLLLPGVRPALGLGGAGGAPCPLPGGLLRRGELHHPLWPLPRVQLAAEARLAAEAEVMAATLLGKPDSPSRQEARRTQCPLGTPQGRCLQQTGKNPEAECHGSRPCGEQPSELPGCQFRVEL